MIRYFLLELFLLIIGLYLSNHFFETKYPIIGAILLLSLVLYFGNELYNNLKEDHEEYEANLIEDEELI